MAARGLRTQPRILDLVSDVMQRTFEQQIQRFNLASWLLMLLPVLSTLTIFTGVAYWVAPSYAWVGSLGSLLLILGVAIYGYSKRQGPDLKYRRPAKLTDCETRLFENIGDEIGLAMGCKPPKISVIDEAAINAYSDSGNVDHVLVVVTRGALDKCEREELVALITHAVVSCRVRNHRMMGMFWAVAMIGPTLFSMIWKGILHGITPSDWWDLLILVVTTVSAFTLSMLLFAGATHVYRLIVHKRRCLVDAGSVRTTRNVDAYQSLLDLASKDEAHSGMIESEQEHVAFVYRGAPKRMKGSLRKRMIVLGELCGASRILWGEG